MVELTEREKQIIHCMHILINPQLKEIPFDVRKTAIQSQYLTRGMKWSEQEATDLILAINQETKETVQNAMALLQKFAPQFKGLTSFNFSKD